MGNDNILKPATIIPSTSSSSNSNNFLDLGQLTSVISEIVQAQTQEILHKINPRIDSTSDIDQTIDDRYLTNLTDLDKIPDIVKCIREFSGNPGEYSSWKKSVDRVLQIYEHLKGTPKYYGILNIIRNKITGVADIALESYNTPLNWQKISKCLTLHYADKRDIGTLEYQMITLVQGNNTIQEFYQLVYQNLSLILNKLSCMEMGQESLTNMTQSYREKALDTFIRGLRGDLPRLLSIREPADLPQALHLCLKLQNMDFRSRYANNSNQNSYRNTEFSKPPPIPRRNIPTVSPQQSFYPELLHNPQSYFDRSRAPHLNKPQFGFTNLPFQNSPQRFYRPQTMAPPYPPKPVPRPEPMDVDGSTNSKQVNYANRPRNLPFVKKRPYFNQFNQRQQPPQKFQRIFHNEQAYDAPNLQQYQDQILECDAEYGQTLVDYTNSQSTPELINEEDFIEQLDEQEEVVELDDINFLD